MTGYPLPPDSMVKMYQIKLVILIETIVEMFIIGGMASFLAQFMRKKIYLWHQKPEKLLKLKYLMQLIGYVLLIFYVCKEVRIARQYNSFFMKLRILLSFTFVILNINIIMPITQYRQMIMIELFIESFMLISYTLTYPCTYVTLIHLIYEVSILVRFNSIDLSLLEHPLQVSGI